jgi:hypothetical protein
VLTGLRVLAWLRALCRLIVLARLCAAALGLRLGSSVLRYRQQRLLRGLADIGAWDIRAFRCTGRDKRSHGLHEQLRGMSFEDVDRAVQAPGFTAGPFGEP